MAIHTYRQPPIPPLWSAREKIGCRVVSLRYLAPQVQVALLRCRHFGRRQPMPDTSPTGQLLASFDTPTRSEEHTSELQSLMRISYAVFCLKKKNNTQYKKL